jgi:hypothetical protein
MRKRFVSKVLSSEMQSWWSTSLRRCSGVLQKGAPQPLRAVELEAEDDVGVVL